MTARGRPDMLNAGGERTVDVLPIGTGKKGIKKKETKIVRYGMGMGE